jgi:hypothetical protein
MYTLVVLIAGIFIGWNLPQPGWAKTLQARAIQTIRSILGGSTTR